MSMDAMGILVGAAAVVAAGLGAVRWLDRTAFLRLSLFRPYRGDPWPRGVQEEDGVRWDWRPAGSRPTEPVDRADGDHDDDAAGIDLGGPPAALPVTRVRRIAIAHPGR